jgi:hypothetical protein
VQASTRPRRRPRLLVDDHDAGNGWLRLEIDAAFARLDSNSSVAIEIDEVDEAQAVRRGAELVAVTFVEVHSCSSDLELLLCSVVYS